MVCMYTCSITEIGQFSLEILDLSYKLTLEKVDSHVQVVLNM